MAMTTNSDLTKAWTVSADHQLVSYDLTTTLSPTGSEAASMKAWSTGQIGHASIALSPNEQVLATGGWDGRIKLFSSTSGKPLGELSYHRESVHILSFAHASPVDGLDGTGTATEVESTIEIGEEDSDSGEEDGSVPPRERWLVSGGKDRRVALWGLMDFSRK
jgi:WD40 repeat protein